MKARILRGRPGDSMVTIELIEADGSRGNRIVVDSVEIEIVPAMSDFGRCKRITPGQAEALYSLGQYVAAVNKVQDLAAWLEDVRQEDEGRQDGVQFEPGCLAKGVGREV